MSETEYSVIFNGQVVPEQNPETVKVNFAKLLKKDMLQVERFFTAKRPIIIKKNLSLIKAKQLQTELTKRTGAVFEVIAQEQPPQAVRIITEPASPYSSAQTPKASVKQNGQNIKKQPLENTFPSSKKPIHRKSTIKKVEIERHHLPITKNIAIFWDIENVNPSFNSLFVDGLLSYANELGKVSYSLAVGDWKHNIHESLPFYLSESGFELVYIPHAPEKGNRKKNSADIILITKATEMIFQLPHITTYVIITGDIDFRPLLQILKKHGKEIIVVCDSNNASESLLEFADNYTDYRDLLPNNDEDEDEEQYSENENNLPENENTLDKELSRQEVFQLLRESVLDMNKQKKIPTPGSVKVRMKLLNENFTGEVEGFTKWQDFINAAVKKKIIVREETNNKIILKVPKSQDTTNATPKIFQQLIKVMAEITGGKKKWINFSSLNNGMMELGIKVKNHKYSQFKQFILDAEKRGLVETQCQGMIWFARLR